MGEWGWRGAMEEAISDRINIMQTINTSILNGISSYDDDA